MPINCCWNTDGVTHKRGLAFLCEGYLYAIFLDDISCYGSGVVLRGELRYNRRDVPSRGCGPRQLPAFTVIADRCNGYDCWGYTEGMSVAAAGCDNCFVNRLNTSPEFIRVNAEVNYGNNASNKTIPWPDSASELYRPRHRRLSAKLVPTSVDRGVSRSQRGGYHKAVISVS
jgi:hypothetical protein